MEEIFDTEYFNEKRLQGSIFMSPAHVHLNRIPMSDEVVYSQYHNGKYLVHGILNLLQKVKDIQL